MTMMQMPPTAMLMMPPKFMVLVCLVRLEAARCKVAVTRSVPGLLVVVNKSEPGRASFNSF